MKSIIPTNLSPESGAVRNVQRSVSTPANKEGHTPNQTLNQTVSQEKILAALDIAGTQLGICPQFKKIKPRFDLHLFESLPSTSSHLWEMLADGEETRGAGTVAIAHQQSAGRGQRGRSWQSEPGGLYLSLALEPDWPSALGAQLTCISAWGIATAFNNLGIPVEVKWPNDLFFEGKKLGGILTETKLSYAQLSQPQLGLDRMQNDVKPLPYIKQAVVGIGINWHNPIPQTGITLAQILNDSRYQAAQNKINCLEVLIALVLRGTMQGHYFYQQVGSQVFMKAYQNLLTQVGNLVSIESNPQDAKQLKHHGRVCQSQASRPERPFDDSISNSHSGKVVGISEEGYLQVALAHSESKARQTAYSSVGAAEDIYLIRPDESPYVKIDQD